MKLAHKIILLMVTTFFGVLLTLGYFESRRAVRENRRLVAAELAITGRALRGPLAEVVNTEGDARAMQLLASANAEMSGTQVRWVPTSTLAVAVDKEKLARGEMVSLEDEKGAGRLYVFVPVPGADAVIEVTQSLEAERALVAGVVKQRLVLALVTVAVAWLIATIAGVRVIGNRMAKLVAHARRIGSGDLEARLSLGGRDEISNLASEMNGMCDQLREAQARVSAETQAKLNAMEQLRHADRLSTIGTLASGMAHELGTPLGIIAGRAKMIASPDTTPEQRAQWAQVISGQVERMTRIMRGLLDFARRTPAHKAPTDVRNLVQRILELLAPLAKKRSVALELRSDGEVFADVDAVQVEQAVANLVVNGMQATRAGGNVVAEVRPAQATPPGADAPRNFVCISVADTGSGIEPEALKHIFEPFFTTKDVGEGTGLGLSVTYGIVQEHGGFIDVASEIERGTRFSVYLPA